MAKFKIIGCVLMYIGLAYLSCQLTADSLLRLIPFSNPTFGLIFTWIVTIAFFIVASIGTKLITDSLFSHSYIENRTGKFWSGILLVFVFWLLISMPTNTHTFFYEYEIGDIVSKDITTTNKYLQQIIDKSPDGKTLILDEEGEKIKHAVEEQRNHIVAQFNGDEPPYKKGNGVVIGDYLTQINKILNSNINQHPDRNSPDPAILKQYHREIDEALTHALKTHTISQVSVDKAKTHKARLTSLADSISDHLATNSLNDAEINLIEKELNEAYGVIAAEKKFIQFDNDKEKELYTREKIQTTTKRAASVWDTFVDFLSGKYPTSFLYYVMLSILIDISAFILFDIAFIKQDD